MEVDVESLLQVEPSAVEVPMVEEPVE